VVRLESGSLVEVAEPLTTWVGVGVLFVTGLALLLWRLLSNRPAKIEVKSVRSGFDSVEALELCGGDEALLKEVACALPAECWSQVEVLRAGLRSGSASTARAAAHRLKGSLLAVSARRSAELAATLERRAIAEELGEMPLLLQALEEELHHLERALARVGGR